MQKRFESIFDAFSEIKEFVIEQNFKFDKFKDPVRTQTLEFCQDLTGNLSTLNKRDQGNIILFSFA